MYQIEKRLEIAGSHQLELPYESKCKRVHGHNWIIVITAEARVLNDDGMVVDFAIIKELVHDMLDHKHLNDVLPLVNPTAENIAKWVCHQHRKFVKVTVQESEGNVATYWKEGE